MVIWVGSCRFGNPTTYDMITTAIMLARNADAETMQRMKYKHSTTRYLNTREDTSVRSVITGFAEANDGTLRYLQSGDEDGFMQEHLYQCDESL